MSPSIQTLYPSIFPPTLSNLPILETWAATKAWTKQNLNTYMNELDQGFAMYDAETEALVAVLSPTAVEEVKPIVEEAEHETKSKQWDEEKQCWV